MDYKNRKSPRLKGYDYSREGAYFITICTGDRQALLCEITDGGPVGADASVRPDNTRITPIQPKIRLTPIGKIVDECWNNINDIYDNVKTGAYVLMPDHLHGIIFIDESTETGCAHPVTGGQEGPFPGGQRRPSSGGQRRPSSGGQRRPPLHRIVQGFKSITTRRCFPFGYKQIWQRSFNDHIIRDEKDYLAHLNYIEQNPVKWLLCNRQEPEEGDL